MLRNRFRNRFRRRRRRNFKKRRFPLKNAIVHWRKGFANKGLEWKVNDDFVSDQDMLSPGQDVNIQPLNALLLDVGSGVRNRVGNSVVLRSVQLKGSIELKAFDQTTGSAPSIKTGRFMVYLILDNSHNKSANAPVKEDIWKSVDTGSYTDYNCPRNPDNSDRFRVLKTWTYDPQNVTVQTWNGALYHFLRPALQMSFSINWSGRIPIEYTYDSSTTTLSNINTNMLFVAFRTQVAQDATFFVPRVQYQERIRFQG